MPGCGGWWAIKQIQAEHLAESSWRSGGEPTAHWRSSSAAVAVQMGTSPRNLLTAVELACSGAENRICWPQPVYRNQPWLTSSAYQYGAAAMGRARRLTSMDHPARHPDVDDGAIAIDERDRQGNQVLYIQ